MENDSDNVISLVQPKRDEEKLLNITVADKKGYEEQRCKHRSIEIRERCGQSIAPAAAVQ